MSDITADRINNIGIIVGLPMVGRPVVPEWALTLACFIYPAGCTHKLLMIKGVPIDEARNGMVKIAKQDNADYIFFLDDDVVPPVDALKHLYPILAKDPQIGAVSGIYPTKEDPPEPTVYKKLGKGAFYNWRFGEVFEAEGIPTGCMLINMKIFEKLEEPYFKTVMEDPKDKAMSYYVSDDLYFCNKVLDTGFKLMAHGGVLCSHWETNLPKDYEPKEYKLTNFLPK